MTRCNKLYAEGVNSFRAVRACDSMEEITVSCVSAPGGRPPRQPHTLLHDRAALKRGLNYVRLQGNRLADILVVEFCDTSDQSGVFRKYSAFVVDKQVLPRHLLFGHNWNLKKPSLKTDELIRSKPDIWKQIPTKVLWRMCSDGQISTMGESTTAWQEARHKSGKSTLTPPY